MSQVKGHLSKVCRASSCFWAYYSILAPLSEIFHTVMDRVLGVWEQQLWCGNWEQLFASGSRSCSKWKQQLWQLEASVVSSVSNSCGSFSGSPPSLNQGNINSNDDDNNHHHHQLPSSHHVHNVSHLGQWIWINYLHSSIVTQLLPSCLIKFL